MINYPKIGMGNKPRIAIKKFLGLNQSEDKTTIPVENAVSMQNCDVDSGTLKRSMGATLYRAVSLATPIQTLMVFYSNDVATILAASNGYLYKLTDSAWVQLTTGFTANDFRYINYKKDLTEIIIFTNGKDNVKVYDGTTFRDLKNRGAIRDSTGAIINWLDGNGQSYPTEAECTSVAPKGKFITLYKERVWLADSHMVYFSKDLDPDDWTTPTDEVEVNIHGGFIDVPTWDGGTIIGLKNLWDDLLIFKTNTVHRIFGTTPDNYELIQVFAEMNGHILDKTIAAGRNVGFWATTHGVFAYSGGTVDSNLTSLIQDDFNTINRLAMDNSVAAIWNDKYILAIPAGNSTTPNLVFEYDINKRIFTVKRGMNISTFIEVNDLLLYADGDGKLYNYNTGSNYNGINIDSFYETGQIFYGDMIFNFDEVNFIASGIGQINIKVITENKTTILPITLTGEDKEYTLDVDNEGKLISFRFENVNGATFEIKQPVFTGYLESD